MAKKIKKGVWLHFIPKLGGKAGIERFVKRYADAGFDLLIPCVKNIDGLLDYHSRVGFVRRASQEYDPLEYMCAVARKAGIKVHAWYCNNPESSKGKLLKEHPEYVAYTPKGKKAKVHNGYFTCFARPQVISYEHDIMAEVAKNWDVDGIHLDYIRTGEEACFCKICGAKFKRCTGVDASKARWWHWQNPKWFRWRIANVTRLVSRISATCKKQGKELSAAVFLDYPGSMYAQSQDFPAWSKAGYLDITIPMNYNADNGFMMAYTRNHVANMEGAGELWEGLGHFMIRNTSRLVEQVKLVKDYGVKGVCIFEHGDITAGDLKALSKL